MAKLVVTITPPTPNGDLHIGHIAGPFMAADVYTRVQRQRGHDCVLLSYSDDYQSYMLRRGMELGRDPVELAKSNTARIRETLSSIDIAVDHWMEPHANPYFEAAVREVYAAAEQAGAIEYRESSEPYCSHCKVWGYEAFGRGNCNYCGDDSDASQCEGCALAPDASKMTNFRCKLCQRAHTWLPQKRAFLKLRQFEPALRALFRGMPLRKPLDSWIEDTLTNAMDDWGVTRPGDAGLDLEADGSRRIHTWFMGLAGYIAAFRENAAKSPGQATAFRDYWQSGQGKLVHFLGHDCAYSHMVVYPALLSTLSTYRIEQSFYPNQFLKLEGLNLSTSRNHAIWARDLVAMACSDSARLYLASIAPEETMGNFELEVFQAWRKEIFTDFTAALIPALERRRDDWSGVLGQDELQLVQSQRQRWLAATSLDHFSMKQLAQIVLDTIELIKGRLAGGRQLVHLAVFLAVAGQSLHPKLSARLLAALGLDADEAASFVLEGTVAEYSI